MSVISTSDSDGAGRPRTVKAGSASSTRSEPEDQLVFVELERDITDPQAHRRDAGGHQEQGQSRPLAVTNDPLERLDEWIGRVEPAAGFHGRREAAVAAGIQVTPDDRRREI